MCVRNVLFVWRKGTCKQKSLYECFRPWGTIALKSHVSQIYILASLAIAAVLILSWAYNLTNYDVNGQCPRLVLGFSGIIFANIAVRVLNIIELNLIVKCRLIVVQMSNTRAEIITPLFVPLLAGIASTSLVLPMVYLARPIWTITFGICLIMHIHYGCGVVW